MRPLGKVRPERPRIGSPRAVALASVLLLAATMSAQNVLPEEAPQQEAPIEDVAAPQAPMAESGSEEIRAPTMAQEQIESYRIGVGDVLGIHVWKEAEVTIDQVTVRTDGKISMPLIKEVHVDGLTPLELTDEITIRLEEYINAPDVTVIVKQINSLVVSMVGGVMRSGPVPMAPGMTVLQAIAGAGGLTDFAKRKKIYVSREVNGKRTRIPYDYQGVLDGKASDVPLRSGDIIIIPD